MLQLISALCLWFIAIVLFLRANDLRARKRNWHWKCRMVGFVLAGSAAFVLPMWQHKFVETQFLVGLVFIFTTSPHLPPFWKWLWKGNDSDIA